MIKDGTKQKKMIKESFDNLPTGIIYAKSNGVIMLANTLMYDLYYQLSNSTLQSAHAFWHSLTVAHPHIRLIEADETPTLQFANDKVFRFSKRTIKISGKHVIQIEAVDISELHHLKQTQLSKREKLIALRQKMFETSSNLEKVTRQEEMLDAKLKIHNSMGMGLASVRRYLETGKGDLDRALIIWRRSIELLVNSDSYENTDLYESFQQAAQSIGVTLNIVGKWPKNNPRAEKTIIAVGRECLINAYLHGAAKQMYIEIAKTKSDYKIAFSNDGKAPSEPIQRGGGFMSIEKTLDEVSGSFEVIEAPQFTVTTTFPIDY